MAACTIDGVAPGAPHAPQDTEIESPSLHTIPQHDGMPSASIRVVLPSDLTTGCPENSVFIAPTRGKLVVSFAMEARRVLLALVAAAAAALPAFLLEAGIAPFFGENSEVALVLVINKLCDAFVHFVDQDYGRAVAGLATVQMMSLRFCSHSNGTPTFNSRTFNFTRCKLATRLYEDHWKGIFLVGFVDAIASGAATHSTMLEDEKRIEVIDVFALEDLVAFVGSANCARLYRRSTAFAIPLTTNPEPITDLMLDPFKPAFAAAGVGGKLRRIVHADQILRVLQFRTIGGVLMAKVFGSPSTFGCPSGSLHRVLEGHCMMYGVVGWVPASYFTIKLIKRYELPSARRGGGEHAPADAPRA